MRSQRRCNGNKKISPTSGEQSSNNFLSRRILMKGKKAAAPKKGKQMRVHLKRIARTFEG